MKKGVMGNLLFASILLVFLSSGIFALDYGTCEITTRAACVSADGGYVIMGLSAATNAHGQFPDVDYPYVICCAFGTGNTACVTTPTSNKIIGLSSATNAHAEDPLQINYLTKVCYEDLACISTLSNCGTNDALTYKLNFTSLSSITNAHIGGINDYPIKICCKSPKFLSSCTLQSASWNTQNAIEGQRIYLQVVGSGAECDSSSLSFEIKGGFKPVKVNATSVAFNGDTATSVWVAEWQNGGLLGGDPQFYFNASIIGNPTKSIVSSNPKLTVKETEIVDYCESITTCSDYNVPEECASDASLCDVAKDSSLPEIDCSDPKILCGCAWDTQTSQCDFGYSEITPGLCESGKTLCQDSSGINYCYPGSSCPPGEVIPGDNDGVCELGDSCASTDCDNGDQDSCVLGATCLDGMCFSPIAVPGNVTCNYGFTLCRALGANYCYPGAECPVGQIPPSNGNLKCDMGEGCLSDECNDGDQDSCSNETYCVFGMCSSVEDPVTIGSFGGCKISQVIEKNCDEEPVGYKTVKWSGTWVGTETSGVAYDRCIAGGRSNVPCPAQVQLPFFGYWGIGITVVIIALVYFFLISKRKKIFKRKKKQNK